MIDGTHGSDLHEQPNHPSDCHRTAVDRFALSLRHILRSTVPSLQCDKKKQKTKLASVSLRCKSRRFKTVKYQHFIHKFNPRKLAITFISVSGLS